MLSVWIGTLFVCLIFYGITATLKYLEMLIEMQPNAEFWTCQECGKENPDYVNMCTCGRKKNE